MHRLIFPVVYNNNSFKAGLYSVVELNIMILQVYATDKNNLVKLPIMRNGLCGTIW